MLGKLLPSCLWYMTAGRNFFLKSVFEMQALSGLGKEGGRVQETERFDVRGRGAKGR